MTKHAATLHMNSKLYDDDDQSTLATQHVHICSYVGQDETSSDACPHPSLMVGFNSL